MLTLMVKLIDREYFFADEIGVGLNRAFSDIDSMETALAELANVIAVRNDIEFFVGLFDHGSVTERYKIEAEYTLTGF